MKGIRLCLGLSVAAERTRMAAIIGAFFAGLSFAEYSDEWRLAPRVSAIDEFLAPFFFFTMGARLDLRVFQPDVIDRLLSQIRSSIIIPRHEPIRLYRSVSHGLSRM